MTLAKQLETALKAAGTKERAVAEKAYLKSDRIHFGVPVPQIRTITRAAAKGAELTHDSLLATVDALWSRGVHELRMAAVELLVRNLPLLTGADLPDLERMLRDAKTWALVDWIATNVVGELVERDPKLGKTLDRWATDDDFWIRRSAMLALLVPLRKGGGDFDRFARYADAMLDEKEFFIRKAIGWILREVSRKRPAIVNAWLAPRAQRASGVTLREAVKYLSAAQRAAITGTAKARRAPAPSRR